MLLFFLDATSVVIGLLAAITLRLGHRAAIIHYLNSPHTVAKFALVAVVFGIALYYSDLFLAIQ